MSGPNHANGIESRDESVRQFLRKSHDVHKQISPVELVQPLQQYPGQVALRFASGEAGHYVRYDPARSELIAVHGGPHGPENRPASIDMRNIALLQRECELIESVPIEDTPFVTPEIRGG